jgi:hypothetical protein
LDDLVEAEIKCAKQKVESKKEVEAVKSLLTNYFDKKDEEKATKVSNSDLKENACEEVIRTCY